MFPFQKNMKYKKQILNHLDYNPIDSPFVGKP